MHRPKYNESKSKIDEKDWNLGARHATLFQYKQAGKERPSIMMAAINDKQPS